MNTSANTKRVNKIKKFQARVQELFEKKYSHRDWDNKTKAIESYFEKCREQASKEIFNA